MAQEDLKCDMTKVHVRQTTKIFSILISARKMERRTKARVDGNVKEVVEAAK
jgi:hypothetical protein